MITVTQSVAADMDDRKQLCVVVVLLLFDRSLPVPIQSMMKIANCDASRSTEPEGNVGQSAAFPWLGLLRVHIHDFDQLKIAVTGLILVKERYAVANADDVSRIPKHVFTQDSKAMFIPKTGDPWFTNLKDYMIHPEFEFATYNTIALVELDLDPGTVVPFKPVCWPGHFFNTSNLLYAVGYTDENELMEKIVYTVQYIKPSLCNEFYNRVGFSEPKSTPPYVQCGFAANNKKDCVWENGMALVSNSTGSWTLIGFGIRGPGCAAPARFIDMSAYLPWVESATDLELIADYPDYRRRSAFRTGFGNNETEEIPTTTPTTTTPSSVLFREWYPGINSESGKFQIYSLTPGQDAWYEMPRHLQEAGFNPGDCSGRRILVYREQMRLVDPNGTPGRAEYKVTLYDEHIQNYTCISVKLENVLSRSPVLIWFRHHMDLLEGTGFKGGMGIDTPEEILKRIPLPKKYELTTEAPPLNGTATPIYKPGKHLEAIFVKDKVNRSGILNINLIIGFTFTGETKMNLRVYGYPIPRFRKPTTTTTTTRMTHRPRRRNKRKDRFERAREREAERRQIRVAGRNHIGYLQYQ